MPNRNTALFGLFCLIWGLTWIAVKAGLQTVPPLFFAGSRFVVAGIVIGVVLFARDEPLRLRWAAAPRLFAVSALLVALTYGLLFWGMQFISSGTAALMELSSTPVALLGFALILRQEAFDRTRALVIALGVVGLAILFGPKVSSGNNPLEGWGALATVLAAVMYGWGSVLARPLIADLGALSVGALTMLLGGLMLLGVSFVLEPISAQTLAGAWGMAAWAGWFYLVLFGSLSGFTIYLGLLDRWGASKAGSYCFVSPVIAMLAGMLVYREKATIQDAIGMSVMLTAAFLAVRTQSTEHARTDGH